MAPASRQTAVVTAPAGTAGAGPAGAGGAMLGTVRTLIGQQAWVLVALAAWTLGPLLAVAVHVLVNGGVMTGANGGDFIDQFQYLAWIRDAGSHGLASNLWVIGHTPHD